MEVIESSIKLIYSDPRDSHPIELRSSQIVDMNPDQDIVLIILPLNGKVATIRHGRYSKTITRRKYLDLFSQLTPLYGVRHQIPSHYQLFVSFRDQTGHDLKWSSQLPDPALDSNEIAQVTQEENSIFDYALVVIQNLYLSTFAFSLKSRRKCGLNSD